MDLLTEIASYMQSHSLGVFKPNGVGGDIFIGTMPATPDVCVALYQTPGGGSPDSKLGYDSRRVQILIRGDKDYRTGAARADAIYAALHGLWSMGMGPIWIISFLAVNAGAAHIGTDDNSRHEFSINFDVECRNKTTNRE